MGPRKKVFGGDVEVMTFLREVSERRGGKLGGPAPAKEKAREANTMLRCHGVGAYGGHLQRFLARSTPAEAVAGPQVAERGQKIFDVKLNDFNNFPEKWRKRTNRTRLAPKLHLRAKNGQKRLEVPSP